MKALAYLNHSRWVCDCPAPGCTDARLVYPLDPATGQPAGVRLTEDVCAKGHRFDIVMPAPGLEAQIVTTVADRPDDADKAWYPKGHVRAVLAGLPTGQSVAELVAENDEVAGFRAAQAEARRDRIATILSDLGIEVGADGTFEGRL